MAGMQSHRLWALLPIMLAGCASVDPRSDYDRASAYIHESTGQAGIQPPEDGAVLDRRVAALLDGGLTLAEAVEVCLLNNGTFQAAWMDVGLARADLVQAGLLSNPVLGISLRLPAGGGLANLEASLAQEIADVWQIPSRQRGAAHALDQAVLGLARRATLLASEVKSTWHRVLGAERVHAIAQEHVAIASQLLEAVEARRQAGAGSELDVNLARSAALEAELSLATERLKRAEARRDLARLLGLTTPADDLVLTEAASIPAADVLDAEAAIAIAGEQRLDIRSARANVAVAAAAVELELLRVFPSVEVGLALERGERQRQSSPDYLADTARASLREGRLRAPELEPRPDQNTDFIIGPTLGMEIPLFDQNQARIARAQFAHRQALHMLDAIERQMAQDVRGAVDRARTARALVTLAEAQSVPLAERNLDLSRESYKAGKTSVLTVLEAQRFLLDARRRHATALVEAGTAAAEVERETGLPLEALASHAASSTELDHEETQEP